MRYILTIIAVCLLAACDKPQCTNTNPVMSRYNPEDKEYKTELVRLIDSIGKHNIDYWIHHYQAAGGREYMYVDLLAPGICAIAVMDITGNHDLLNFRRVQGKSYSGAGLSGLDYTIEPSDSSYNFVFKNVDYIID